ncbi:MAG: GNAT family N-acetyltransferase [Candidatus Hodarchaeota archaeon]
MVFLIINDVTSKDLRKIVNLEQEIFKENAFSKDLLKKLIEKHTFFLKLEKGKIKHKIIGFIIVINDKKERANIINFLIKPKFQNMGYGSYLLQETIAKINQLKSIKKIVLNVQISNSIAIKMYENFNFKRNPTIIENYYHSGESAYLMELDIDS